MTLVRQGPNGPADLVRSPARRPYRGPGAGAPPDCAGLVIVHQTGALTCSEPSCDHDMVTRSPFERHVSFFSCTAVLGGLCEECGPGQPGT
jgi:hypothetical protein